MAKKKRHNSSKKFANVKRRWKTYRELYKSNQNKTEVKS